MDCWIINRYFADSASFCWHSVFFADSSIFCWYSTFLLSHHQAFCGLVKFCWHSIFCWLD